MVRANPPEMPCFYRIIDRHGARRHYRGVMVGRVERRCILLEELE
jgi:hypothetical protein